MWRSLSAILLTSLLAAAAVEAGWVIRRVSSEVAEPAEALTADDFTLLDEVANVTNSDTLTLDATGATEGALLLAVLGHQADYAMSTPAAGWTEVTNRDDGGSVAAWGYVYSKTAGASESTHDWVVDNAGGRLSGQLWEVTNAEVTDSASSGSEILQVVNIPANGAAFAANIRKATPDTSYLSATSPYTTLEDTSGAGIHIGITTAYSLAETIGTGATNGTDELGPADTDHTLHLALGYAPPVDYSNYVYLDGTTGQNISTSDHNSQDPDTGIRLEALVAMDDWTPADHEVLISKYDSSINQRSWALRINDTGHLALLVSDDGISPQAATSTVTVPVIDGEKIWVAVELFDGSPKTTRFYTATPDGDLPDPGDWTQLGGDLNSISKILLHNSTAGISVGSLVSTGRESSGKFYYAAVKDAAGAILARFDASDGTDPTYNNVAGQAAWTNNGGAPGND